MNQKKTKLIINKPQVNQHELTDINRKSNQSQINRIIPGSASHRFGGNIPNVCSNADILNTCMDGFWLIDLQGNILEVNDAYCNMIGYSRDELLSMNVRDVEASESPEEIIDHTEKIQESGCDRLETQHRRKDGTILDIEVAVNHLEIEKGFISAFIRDITERKRAENKIRQLIESYNRITDNADVAIIKVELTKGGGKVVYQNCAAERIFGYSQADWDSDPDLGVKIIHPDYAEKHGQVLEQISTLKKPIKNIVLGWIAKNGREVIMEYTIIPIIDTEGNLTHFESIGKDITERKRAEEALRAFVETTSGSTGQDFFDKMVSWLAYWLGVDCVLISRIIEGNKAAAAYAMFLDGEIIHDYSYELSNSPCEKVVEKGFCLHEEGINNLFPEDSDLAELKAEGYIGIPLRNDKGNTYGILCAISRKKLVPPPRTKELMEIVAARTTAEIERTLAEEALRDNEKLLRTIAENYPNSYISIIEKDYTVGFASGQEFRNQNIDPNQYLGLTLDQIFGEHADFIRLQFGKAFNGEEHSFEFEMNNRLNQYRAVPLHSEDGSVPRILVVVENITMRKQAEDKIRQLIESYDRLTDNADEAVFKVELTGGGKVVYLNRAAERIFGYTLADWDSDPDLTLKLIHPDYAEKHKQIFEQVSALKKPIKNVVLGWIAKNGHDVIMEYTIIPIIDTKGNLTHFESIGKDITERMRAEKAQQQLTHQLGERVKELDCLYGISHLVESNTASLKCIIDGTCNIIKESWQHPDVTCARIIVNGNEFTTPNFMTTEWKQSAEIKAKKKVIGHVEVYYLKSMPEFDEGPFLKEERSLINAIAERLGKIIERKQAEKELKLAHDSLEVRVKERTADLLKANKLLEKEITERKQAEEKLKNSERKSHAWLENSPICTKVVDPDFNLKYMSSAGIKALNIDDITQFYGKPYPFDFYPDSFRTVMTSNLEKAKETGETVIQEATVVDMDGNELWFHSTIVPVNDDEGRIDYIMILSVDTTDRKQAEVALRESEKRLLKVQEIAKVGFLEWNLETDEIFLSDTIIDLYKLDTGTKFTTPEFVAAIVHPDDLVAARENLEVIKKDETPHNIDHRVILPDGKIIWIHAQHELIYDSKGKPESLLGTVIDITERKQMEDALLESNEQLIFKHKALEDKNIALKEVLSQIEDDKKKMASRIQSNIDRIVKPMLRRLNDKVGQAEKNDILLIGSSLEQATIPFVSKLEALYGKLTPREVEICNMIKSGLGSKEIASLLNTSFETVRSQRKHIRKKLGITGEKTSLTSILRTT